MIRDRFGCAVVLVIAALGVAVAVIVAGCGGAFGWLLTTLSPH